jgi:hypothetical protein
MGLYVVVSGICMCVSTIEFQPDITNTHSLTRTRTTYYIKGMLILLAKKISLKAMVKKKAFLTIGGMVDSAASMEKNVVVVPKTPPTRMASTLMMGFSYSRYIGTVLCEQKIH